MSPAAAPSARLVSYSETDQCVLLSVCRWGVSLIATYIQNCTLFWEWNVYSLSRGYSLEAF